MKGNGKGFERNELASPFQNYIAEHTIDVRWM